MVSIGPRPFRHGNVQPDGQHHPKTRKGFQLGHVLSDMEMIKDKFSKDGPYYSFNWATSFQTWKSALQTESWIGDGSFNWATSFQTWKCLADVDKVALPAEGFQLGHVLSDMEIPPARREPSSR